MKRFGVQIAAGCVTILLGVLAAAHAQKDRGSDSELSWDAGSATDLRRSPTPIEDLAVSDWNADPTATLETDSSAFGSAVAEVDPLGFPTPEPTPVRLVQHTEHADQGSLEVQRSAAEEPEGRGRETPSADPFAASMTPPSLSLPRAFETGSGTELAPGSSSIAEASEAADPGLPSLTFDQPPAMEFLGFPGDADASSSDDAPPPGSWTGPSSLVGQPTMGQPTMGQPVNGLRESPHDFSPAVDPYEAAQPDERFAGPAAFGFEPPSAPAPPPAASERSHGTSDLPAEGLSSGTRFPQAGSESQSEPNGQPMNTAAVAPRLASLPRDVGQAHSAPQIPASFDRSFSANPGIAPSDRGMTDSNQTATTGSAEPRTIGSPGDRRLDGAQTPSVVIQKRAPAEVKVGKPASFVIQVRNVGSVEAIDVQLYDRVPVGMRLADASPAPLRRGDELLWELGTLPVGDERTVTMQLIPEQEGELGSVARVSFEAAASVRTISTRPELKIVQRAPEAVLIGQQLEIELEVSNPGTGEATSVVLQVDVPEGLEHPKGRQLDNLLGNLQPGEVRREVLRLRAVSAGQIENTVRLVSDDGLTAENTIMVEVVAPQLQVRLNGPTRRYVERQATYELQVGNIGTAEATNVEIAAYLDRGFTFVSTGNQGQYDPARHAVFWSLARLPRDTGDSVPLTLLPVEVGAQAIRLQAVADLGAEDSHEQTVSVDSLAELTFQIADSADPIELGSETTYEIRVTNSGSRNDSDVRVQLQLPPGLELLSSDVDADHDGRGGVLFQPRAQLAAGGELSYRVKVRGVAPGRHVTKVTVVSDQSDVAVTKEESTMVYADR